MYCKKRKAYLSMTMIIIAMLFINLTLPSFTVNAFGVEDKEEIKVLVVYASRSGEIDEYQRMLDMLLGGFTEDIVFRSSSQVEKVDLKGVTHLFYYGQERERIPEHFLQLLKHYEGAMVAIGHNVEQMGERFAFIGSIPNEVVIDHIVFSDEGDQQLSISPRLILNTYPVELNHSKVLLVGRRGRDEYPLLIENKEHYYFACVDVRPPFSIPFAAVLHQIFDVEGEQSNPGYIRIEDIHPLVDHKNLMEIAKVLKEKNIPYMIAVIPVYTNPETGEQYHFSDSPKLLRVLKHMQNNGGSIVLHGYTHQFRLSETGEGFEFWDVEHNMPIYHHQNDVVAVKKRRDFKDEVAYEAYVDRQKAFERDYIETKLTKGIQELANYGLYPLAFEAPHYTMSQQGYEITSEFFSTYVGQIQLSDENWEIMSTAPYITKPTFLKGMILLPETIGYVAPEDPQAIQKMMDAARDYGLLRNGMVAGFYHPYLGVESFVELIEEMENLPHLEWIDLKQMDSRVHAEHVEIITIKGEMKVKLNHMGLFFTSSDYLIYHIKRLIRIVAWGIAAIGTLAVMVFIRYILIGSFKNKD